MKSKSPTEWLDEICEKYIYTDYYYDGEDEVPVTCVDEDDLKQAILNHVEELVNEVIGTFNDVSIEDPDMDDFKHGYNQGLTDLLAEQRARAKQLLKGKD